MHIDFNLREILDKFKIPIGLSLVGIVLIIGGMVTSGIGKQNQKTYPKESLIESVKGISVDVSGAVLKPGVYQLTKDARVEDAISTAGGFSEEVNKEYISKYLNMAQKLSDGSKIYVPFAGDPSTGSGEGGGISSPGGVISSQGKININSSTQSELEALPGIGPVTAAKIISGRPYQKIENLLDQKIVSKSVFEKIRGSISIY